MRRDTSTLSGAYIVIITLNGRPKETREGTTLEEILCRIEGDISAAAVALNEAFLPKEKHAETILNDGDTVEVVSPHPGG